MPVHTVNSGHFLFTSDRYPVRDIFEQDLVRGWLGRDATVLDELLVQGGALD